MYSRLRLRVITLQGAIKKKSQYYSIIIIFLSARIMFLRIPITFNNPLKVCFSKNKYTITGTTQTRPIQIVKVYLLLKNRVSTDF